MIEPGIETEHYSQWATQRGSPSIVIPLRFVGMRGWDKFVQKKTVDGKEYAAEIWECETEEGLIENLPFRIEYDHIKERKVFNGGEPVLRDYANAHYDGLIAYLSGDVSKKRKTLLNNRITLLNNKITELNVYFKELNNIEHRILKMGVQLYLRRLETPTNQTSREWKQFSQEHPYYKEQIMDRLKETGLMTSNV